MSSRASRPSALGGVRRSNADIWRASVDRFVDLESRADRNAWIDYATRICHPDIEWDLNEFAQPPNIPIVLYGIDSVRAFWEHWLDAWVPLGIHYDMVDAGDSVVMLVEEERLRARGTDGVLEMEPYAQCATFDGGLMVTWKAYASQSRALEVAWGEDGDPPPT